jgi:hypothetical protein
MSVNPEPTPTQADLVARLNLMETMIAEGRRATGRFGWIFVLWGLVYCAAMAWCAFLPHRNWAWPVCVVTGVAASIMVRQRQNRAGVNLANPRTHSITSVWRAMGIAVSLFSIACAVSHQIEGPVYICAVMFLVGLAHATSALILRWAAQGVAAAVWWTAGIAALFFTEPEQLFLLFMLATLFGMVLFGLYAMVRERHRAAPPALPSHA